MKKNILMKNRCGFRLLLLASVFWCGTVAGITEDPYGKAAGDSLRQAVFGHGEELTYVVSYKIGFVNTDVAGVTMTTTEPRGDSVYNIEAAGRVFPAYRWFFDLNDVYVSRLDKRTLRPVDLKIELREGKYRASASYVYDWERMRVNTSYHNHKRESPTLRTMPLGEGSFDGLALFYNLRCADAGTFVPGRTETMDLVLDDTVRRMQYRFLGRETKHVRGTGKFRTLKFACILVTSTGESFDDGSEMILWVSDDRNKIPLYLETPIKVGSVRVRLVSAQNLKYPLESKIK